MVNGLIKTFITVLTMYSMKHMSNHYSLSTKKNYNQGKTFWSHVKLLLNPNIRAKTAPGVIFAIH